MTVPRHVLPYGFKITLPKDPAKKTEYHYFVNPAKLKSVSFKGGGFRVSFYQTFLEIAQLRGVLADIKEFGGSSSGSIVAVFAAIPFENPKKRTDVLRSMNAANLRDVMDDSESWQAYRWLSPVLNIVSKPFEVAAQSIDNKAKSIKSKLLRTPIKLSASFLNKISFATSPEGVASIYNLVFKGGLYQGKVAQETLRDAVQENVQIALDQLLRQISSAAEKASIIKHLYAVGVFQENRDERVTADLTFNHFAELAKLPNSQFKEIFMTGMKLSDKSLMIFNKKNSPDMPLHVAMRIAISLPLFFQSAFYGEYFTDGGTIDNSPGRHATPQPLTPFQIRNGITDDMTRLNVRVEYQRTFDFLWKSQHRGLLKRTLDYPAHWALKQLTGGVDSYATERETHEALHQRFAQRTLQMDDFGVGRTQNDLDPELLDTLCELSAENVNFYFDQHLEEKVKIENYHLPDNSAREEKSAESTLLTMPSELQIRLLVYLKNPEVHSEEIFCVSDKTLLLEKIRQQTIEQLQALPVIKKLGEDPVAYLRRLDEFDPSTTTTKIFRQIAYSKELASIGSLHEETRVTEEEKNDSVLARRSVQVTHEVDKELSRQTRMIRS